MADLGDIPISRARGQLGGVIDRARTAQEPVYLTRRGKRVAAIIGVDELERLIELAEDMIDIRGAAEARSEMQKLAKQAGLATTLSHPDPD